MKKLTKKVQIDTSKYVNMETGELLSSEHSNITSINTETTLVKVDYKEYVMIDSKAKEYIIENFNHAETGRIFDMCDMVRTAYNIICNKKTKIPHTKQTLMTELDYTRSKFLDFLKKLYNKSIISYLLSRIDGKDCILIVLNPTLARKRKFIEKDTLKLFTDLSKVRKAEEDSDLNDLPFDKE